MISLLSMACICQPMWQASVSAFAIDMKVWERTEWNGCFRLRMRISERDCSMLTDPRRKSPATARAAWRLICALNKQRKSSPSAPMLESRRVRLLVETTLVTNSKQLWESRKSETNFLSSWPLERCVESRSRWEIPTTWYLWRNTGLAGRQRQPKLDAIMTSSMGLTLSL